MDDRTQRGTFEEGKHAWVRSNGPSFPAAGSSLRCASSGSERAGMVTGTNAMQDWLQVADIGRGMQDSREALCHKTLS